jgi:hypothetical protein
METFLFGYLEKSNSFDDRFGMAKISSIGARLEMKLKLKKLQMLKVKMGLAVM